MAVANQKRGGFCGPLAASAKKAQEVDVRVYVTCPSCKLEITPANDKLYWTAGDIKAVGMFKAFDCPDCGRRLQLPLALFSLHQEPKPLRSVRGGSSG